jgi:hypothetical protein
MEPLRRETIPLSFGPAVVFALVHQHNAWWPTAEMIASRIPKYGFAFCDSRTSSWSRLFTSMFIHESDEHLIDVVIDITSTYWIIFLTERGLDTAGMLRDAVVGVLGGALAGLLSYHLHWNIVGTVQLTAADPDRGIVGAVTRPLASLLNEVLAHLTDKPPPLEAFYCGAEPLVGVLRGFHLALRPQLSLAIPPVGRLLLDAFQLFWFRFACRGTAGQLENGLPPLSPDMAGFPVMTYISSLLGEISWFRRWKNDLFAPHCGFFVGVALGLAWKAVLRRHFAMRRQGAGGFMLRAPPNNPVPAPRPIVLPAALQVANPRCPAEFTCPLSRCLMEDPVVTADGQTYERAAIEHWFSLGHTTSPLTNVDLPYLDLVPNFALRQIMSEWQ